MIELQDGLESHDKPINMIALEIEQEIKSKQVKPKSKRKMGSKAQSQSTKKNLSSSDIAKRNLIKTWKALADETKDLKEQMREKMKRQKAMEEMILQSMKRNNIGALDLKSSGGRLLYRRKTSKGSLGNRDITKLLADHLKSETKAAEVMKYLDEHRGSKVKESLLYETE